MPVFNAEQYLKEAIDSILCQSFRDFEFLIYNDGSTDSSAAIIQSYQDSRIRFFNYPVNSGYVTHLNNGIRIARGEYLARMDADDISVTDRLEKQVSFMDANLKVGVCGSWYDIIGNPENIITIPQDHETLLINLTLNSVFGHPVVMMRKSILDKHKLSYDEQYMPAEDFHLWVKMSRVSHLANLGEVLLHYRKHSNQISFHKQQYQLEKIQQIRELQPEFLLGRKLTENEIQVVAFLFGTPGLKYEHGFFNQVLSFANLLLSKNAKKKFYPVAKFEDFVYSRLRVYFLEPVYRNTLQPDPGILLNRLKKIVVEDFALVRRWKFYVKCLIKSKSSF